MNSQPSLFTRTYDITLRKHKGNAQSVDANPTDNRKELQRETILNFITSRMRYGATSGEIELWLHIAKNRFSGRITELRNEKLIVKRGVREGCGVWVSVRFAEVQQ